MEPQGALATARRSEARGASCSTTRLSSSWRSAGPSNSPIPRCNASTRPLLRKAAAAYVRQYHFRPDASPYQVLGVAPDASAQAIRDSFRLLMQLVHPDRQDARTEWPEAFAARANRAYATLRDADSRAECDRELRQRDERERMARETASAAARVRQAHWPNAGQRVRKPPPQDVLPEWLTAGVGGFVRAHPAVMAFGSLIVVAALVIAGATWDTQTDSLARQTTSRTSPLAAAEPGPVADPEIVQAGDRAGSCFRHRRHAGAAGDGRPDRDVRRPCFRRSPERRRHSGRAIRGGSRGHDA